MKKLSLLPAIGVTLLLSSLPMAIAAETGDIDHETSFEELKTKMLDRYRPLIEKFSGAEQVTMLAIDPTLSVGNGPGTGEDTMVSWWHEKATVPLAGMKQYTETNIPNLYSMTLHNSSQVKVFGYLPLIRKTTIQEAEGEFDTSLYASAKYNDIDEPVGDDLRTGGPERYEEESGALSVGLERKFITGTTLSLEQGYESFDSNSTYLNPNEQGISKTSLTLTQSLLKGFGPDYNDAIKELAKIDYKSANSELKRQLDSHLLEVTRSYWGLYMERSLYLQKQRLADKTKEIVRKMEERKDIDVEASLLARAKSQMFGHQLAADEARFSILNAQSRIWTLTNAPELVNESGLEYVTVEKPLHALPQESMEDVFTTALKNRPEIEQSLHQLESALLRHYRTKNELLPELDLFAQTYVKGLEGDYDHSEAWNESWDEGDPSYSVGLRLSFPLMNNAAKAREMRKRLEVKQLTSQLDTTVTNILLEAQITYREMIKYNMAMKRRYAVVQSTNQEIDSLISRIDYLISKNEEYGSILYRLLDALERLNIAEMEFSTSELTYNLSLVQLKSAKGTLIDESGVMIEESEEEGLPETKINIDKLKTKEEQVPLSLVPSPELDKSTASSSLLAGLTTLDDVNSMGAYLNSDLMTERF
jgi:outer membrane protein TolC